MGEAVGSTVVGTLFEVDPTVIPVGIALPPVVSPALSPQPKREGDGQRGRDHRLRAG